MIKFNQRFPVNKKLINLHQEQSNHNVALAALRAISDLYYSDCKLQSNIDNLKFFSNFFVHFTDQPTALIFEP